MHNLHLFAGAPCHVELADVPCVIAALYIAEVTIISIKSTMLVEHESDYHDAVDKFYGLIESTPPWFCTHVFFYA